MRISAKAEYACAAMLELATGYGKPSPVPISAIAQSQGLPSRFLVQVLLQLQKAGLVTSIRGKSGGYQLARAPDSISLAAIINAIDDKTVSPRVSTLSKKARHTPMVEVLLAVWQDVRVQEQRILERISLADLLQRTQPGALTYQI
jgi:Rrf2 family protein